MGKFENVRAGDTVYVTVKSRVREIGVDKNGTFLQTEGNRFYSDQADLKKVRVTDAAPSFAGLKVGTVIKFDVDEDFTYTINTHGAPVLNGEFAEPGFVAFGDAGVAATFPYTVLYEPINKVGAVL